MNFSSELRSRVNKIRSDNLPTDSRIPWDLEAQTALVEASEFAHRLQAQYVNIGHLLFGILYVLARRYGSQYEAVPIYKYHQTNAFEVLTRLQFLRAGTFVGEQHLTLDSLALAAVHHAFNNPDIKNNGFVVVSGIGLCKSILTVLACGTALDLSGLEELYRKVDLDNLLDPKKRLLASVVSDSRQETSFTPSHPTTKLDQELDREIIALVEANFKQGFTVLRRLLAQRGAVGPAIATQQLEQRFGQEITPLLDALRQKEQKKD